LTKPKIYLAGAITGATSAEAKDWRRDIAARLAPHGIACISPLRSEPAISGRYDLHYPDPCFGTPAAIVGKNFLDVQACDFVLANLPTPPENGELESVIERMANLSNVVQGIVGPIDDDAAAIAADVGTLMRIARKGVQRSLGTVGEISWAHVLRKPCAIVSDDAFVRQHPFVTQQTAWQLDTLDDAVRLIVGLFADYAR
jgi:hypothetical protein